MFFRKCVGNFTNLNSTRLVSLKKNEKVTKVCLKELNKTEWIFSSSLQQTDASPPPTLITLTPGGRASQRDTDTGESTELLGGASVDAVAMVFDSENQRLYWLDTDKKLKTSPLYDDDIQEVRK